MLPWQQTGFFLTKFRERLSLRIARVNQANPCLLGIRSCTTKLTYLVFNISLSHQQSILCPKRDIVSLINLSKNFYKTGKRVIQRRRYENIRTLIFDSFQKVCEGFFFDSKRCQNFCLIE